MLGVLGERTQNGNLPVPEPSADAVEPRAASTGSLPGQV